MAAPRNFAEIFYAMFHAGVLGTGKTAAADSGPLIQAAVNNSGIAAAGALGPAVATLGVMGLTSAVSAGVTQMDYIHKKHSLRDFYQEEVAAKLGKKKGKATTQDLETLAKGDAQKGVAANHVIGEELGKTRRLRNFGIVFSVMASLASLAVVQYGLNPALAHGVSEALGFAATDLAAKAIEFVIHGGLAVVTYNLIKAPLHWLGDKIFGLDKETTHDRIKAIHRDREDGKTITQEQVLSVFVSANKELKEFVVAKYGRKFDDLTYPDKHAIAEHIGPLIHLQELTVNINHNRMNATELAFAAEGQISGVELKDAKGPQKHGLLAGFKQKFHRVIERWNDQDMAKNEVSTVAKETIVKEKHEAEYDNPAPKVSFVERVGRPRINTELGHVQQLEQARGSEQLVTRS